MMMMSWSELRTGLDGAANTTRGGDETRRELVDGKGGRSTTSKRETRRK